MSDALQDASEANVRGRKVCVVYIKAHKVLWLPFVLLVCSFRDKQGYNEITHLEGTHEVMR